MRTFLAALLVALPLAAAATTTSVTDNLDEEIYSKVGKASYYSSRLHGRKTASGEPYDQSALTAAHPDLPFGTVVCVTNRRCLLYTSPSPRDRQKYRMPSSA